MSLIWFLEPGNFVIGLNPKVAIAQIGSYNIDIPREFYGIKGNVYTSNFGIELILRNLYRAKEIEKFIIVGNKDVDYFKPYDGLIKLHKYGVDERGKIRDATGYRAYLKNVSKDEIEHFRSLDLIDFMGSEFDENVIPRVKPVNIDVKYIEKSVDIFDFPLRINVEIEDNTLFNLWKKAVRTVYIWGKETRSERGRVKEIFNLISILKKPVVGEKFFQFFPKEEFESYVKNSFLDPREPLNATYTYGNRMFEYGKLESVISYLEKHSETRRALVVLWDPNRDIGKVEDVPCLTQIQFMIRDSKLYTIAYFRSHDIVKAYPENLFGLLNLIRLVMKRTSTNFGSLTVISASAHIYEEDFEIAKNLTGKREIISERYIPFRQDPAGNFIIIPRNNKIIVELRDNSNNTVLKVIGSDAMSLSSYIARLFPSLRPEHYLYLGRELQKAELYIKGILNKYIQG